jgi:hypothetical protein
MKLASQHIKRIAAILALTAASTSAFAQSSEYRRGYDDGYAAGQRAAHEGRGGRGDRDRGQGRLQIEEATWGVRGAMCDARPAAVNEFERNGGIVRAGNQLCGDPARGEPKRLSIVYRCGRGESERVVIRENEKTRLSCRG